MYPDSVTYSKGRSSERTPRSQDLKLNFFQSCFLFAIYLKTIILDTVIIVLALLIIAKYETKANGLQNWLLSSRSKRKS